MTVASGVDRLPGFQSAAVPVRQGSGVLTLIVLNLIWVAFVLVGFAAALVQAVQGDLEIFSRLLTGLFDKIGRASCRERV